MALTLAAAARLLREHHLLREIIDGGTWTLDPSEVAGADAPFTDVTYDTRRVEAGALLFCKGNFRPEYLDALATQPAAWVGGTDYSAHCHAPGLVVSDVTAAMSLLSAEFYGRPQDELTVVGITGTKGKTTTAYLTQALLGAATGGKCALFSSVDNCLDGVTYVESDLTTPESLDAFRMMRQARDLGMTHLVMEVSSQAYKVNRVHGLTFDVGAFLNISPDHISPIEHPSFEDYLWCKRQLIVNSRALVLGARCAHADLLRQDAAAAGVPVTTFGLAGAGDAAQADITASPTDADRLSWNIAERGDAFDGELRLAMDGDFNYANAAAATAIALAAGLTHEQVSQALPALAQVRVPGRMERFEDPDSDTVAIVDYAHNFASVTALLDYVDERYGKRKPRVTLVTGSAGNKALDRRKEIVEAALGRVEHFVFTAEDTDTEPFIDICMEMKGYVTDPNAVSTVIDDRATAITNAVYDARAHADRLNVLLIIGKGDERWIKNHHDHVPYEGDDHIISRLYKL